MLNFAYPRKAECEILEAGMFLRLVFLPEMFSSLFRLVIYLQVTSKTCSIWQYLGQMYVWFSKHL